MRRLADTALAVLLATLPASILAPGCGSTSSKAPTYVTLSVEALDGGTIDLARYRGRVVVLHLFTSWSLTAQSDVPQLTAAHQRYGDQLAVIGVALDTDGYRVVAPWREVNAVPYLIALGSPDLVAGKSSLGPIKQVPATLVIDRRSALVTRIDAPLAPGQLDKILADLGLRPDQR